VNGGGSHDGHCRDVTGRRSRPIDDLARVLIGLALAGLLSYLRCVLRLRLFLQALRAALPGIPDREPCNRCEYEDPDNDLADDDHVHVRLSPSLFNEQ
jgi:hypothetical protein